MSETGDVGAKASVYRELPCQLDEAELRQRGEQLAVYQGQAEATARQKKEDAKYHSDKLKFVQAKMELVAKELRDRQEIRSVEVVETIETSSKMMLLCRIDTGEEIGRRPMTELELQRTLFPVEQTPLDAAAVSAMGHALKTDPDGPAGGDNTPPFD